MNEMTRLTRQGDKQSVELPEGYQFEGAEVVIRREGPRVVLEPRDLEINAETGLPLETLRKLIQEGLDSGPSEPWNLEETKRYVRARHK